jgi:uncharacterized protein YacL
LSVHVVRADNREEHNVSAEFSARIVGMIVFLVAGIFGGLHLAATLGESPYRYAVIFMLLGALAGLVLTPYITLWPFRALKKGVRRAPAQQLMAAVVGLVVGLIVAALLSFPLSLLGPPLGQILPFVAAIVCAYLGVMIMTTRQFDIVEIVRGQIPTRGDGRRNGSRWHRPVLLDTSVIIDGRILDVSLTGFVEGEMLVPRFVLNELQQVADSSDRLRRRRGRRGLEMLHRLQSESMAPVRIVDMDIDDARGVDDKLVLLARRMNCPIITNDYNLNQVAELQGVRVLNINALANAVRAVVLPGETLGVRIVREGKEPGQGVAFLDDGTMIVVEDGSDSIGEEREIAVTKVLQTAAGRMLFARLDTPRKDTE